MRPATMWETDVTDQTASDQLRVVIADDASAMRALLRRMLEDSTAFEIVGEAADGEEAVSLAGALHPDVVLLDVAMPGMDGLEAIPGIRRMSPTTRIVVLSAIEASRVKAQALASGADAFIEKRMVSDSLALRLVEACRMPRLHPGDETGHETGTAADCIVGLAASEHPAVQPYRELAWFRVAFEHAPIGIALVELDGRIETVNEAFCRIVGHSSEQLVGTGVHRISHPGDVVRHAGLRDHMLRALPNYQAEPTYQAEHRFVRADGQVAWTLVTCSLLKAGEGTPSRFVWQVVDISERKSAEAATVRFDELRERYEKELAHSNADLAQLAAVAAHDLKSPLQVISGFAALLEQTQADVLDERGQEFLGFILKSATRMNTLIDDLLAYARVGTDRRPYVVVPLDRVMEEVRAVLSAQTQATGGSVESEPLPVVTGDPAYFVHVLQDLVANGLKFVAEGTTPRVTVSASRMVNAWCIDVVDNGIGIDSQHRTHVFGMFHRLHRNEYEGTGIGLAICKRLVEQRGGSIWVESNPQGGSRVRFTVPDESLGHVSSAGDDPGSARDVPGSDWPAGSRLDEPHLAAAHVAGSNVAGSHVAGSHVAGSHVAGSHVAGGHVAGANVAGSNSDGVARDGTRLDGTRPDGTQFAGLQVVRAGSPDQRPVGTGGAPVGDLDVLLVEDDDSHARLVAETLAGGGDDPDGEYRLRRARDLVGARAELQRHRPDCILLDLFLPDCQGLESLRQLTTLEPMVPIVILTSTSDEQLGLQAVHEGAQDYLVKGTVDGPRLSRALRHAVERKALEARFAEQALHDPLTGLANRTLLLDRLRLELARTGRTGKGVAVFYLDVDGFKAINDRWGHDAGDEVLVRVARRLSRVVRPGDTVGRIGGDEFLVVCGGLEVEGDLEHMQARIAEVLGRPLLLGGGTELVTASIGVAVGHGLAEEPEAIIRRADESMYEVKRGRHR